MKFRDKLKTLRAERGLSQGNLAGLAGLNKLVISKYERGAATPGLENLAKLARALDVTADYLIFDNAPKDSRRDFSDVELFEAFARAENLPDEDRAIVKTMIDALATRIEIDKLSAMRTKPKRIADNQATHRAG